MFSHENHNPNWFEFLGLVYNSATVCVFVANAKENVNNKNLLDDFPGKQNRNEKMGKFRSLTAIYKT